MRYASMNPHGLDLLLVGSKLLEIPAHPRIRHLGFLSDSDKFDAIAAADVLIMPSRFESLSMVALEAWALGRPVLANGHCDVLRGQVIRSNGGLYYDTFEEFAEALYALEAAGPIGGPFGRNGREYFRQHYTWPVIEKKYLDMFEQLTRDPRAASLEPMPGLMARRRRDLPPAAQVVNAVKAGPVVH
jgi:glycosyltransferase involved in cell wall biosynthesis